MNKATKIEVDKTKLVPLEELKMTKEQLVFLGDVCGIKKGYCYKGKFIICKPKEFCCWNNDIYFYGCGVTACDWVKIKG